MIFWDVVVQRLNANLTSETSIKAHFASKKIEVREINIYPSSRKGCVTARVRFALKHKELALNSDNFGPFIQFSSWTGRSKSARKNEAITGNDAGNDGQTEMLVLVMGRQLFLLHPYVD